MTHTNGNITTITRAGYEATIFATTDGDKIFVRDPQGNQIYAHRTNKGQGIERAWKVVNESEIFQTAAERWAA